MVLDRAVVVTKSLQETVRVLPHLVVVVVVVVVVVMMVVVVVVVVGSYESNIRPLIGGLTNLVESNWLLTGDKC